MKDQKGFIVYSDIKAVIDELTDEQVSQLFRGMVGYFVDGKAPKFSGILKFVFIPIKQQMDRDSEKYRQKCEKNRANANERWKNDANACDGMRTDANDANTNTTTNTDTEVDKTTITDTTTTTDTNGGGSGGCDDSFDIRKLLGRDGIDKIYAVYPKSAGYLIDEVFQDVKTKKKKVLNPVAYVLGYAKNVAWDDNAEHFVPPWEVIQGGVP